MTMLAIILPIGKSRDIGVALRATYAPSALWHFHVPGNIAGRRSFFRPFFRDHSTIALISLFSKFF